MLVTKKTKHMVLRWWFFGVFVFRKVGNLNGFFRCFEDGSRVDDCFEGVFVAFLALSWC